jgi:hypothetical protein
MIDFPTSPVSGDSYTYGGRTWVWNGSGWERQVNAGQIVSVFITPGAEVQQQVTGLPYTISADWHQLNYV